MARSALDNMAWSADPLVREIYSEVDDRPREEIADSIYEAFLGTEYDPAPDRSFQEPRATEHLTKKQAAAATLKADEILGWAIYAVDYRDYSNPPWERSGNPRSADLPVPWVAKLDQWMPSPEGVARGSRFHGGGYWTVMRQGGLTSGGFKTRTLATAWKASPEFKRRYTSASNPRRKGRKKNPKTKKRVTNVRSLVAKALK